MTTEQQEQAYQKLAQELIARQIPKEITGEAISYIGELLPTLDEYDSEIRLALFGIACYTAGYRTAGEGARA